MIKAYPLTWPAGWPRTKDKLSSRFKTTVAAALKNVSNSLVLFGKDSETPTTDIVISSNVSLGNNNPNDCGVAVWFTWEKKQLCIAVDRYKTVQENLQAIHLIIESRRTELRHGGLHLFRQAFTGFKALPEKSGSDTWFNVLGISDKATEEAIKEAYRKKAAIHHPDKGGDSEMFNKVTEAYRQALQQLGK
jgi:hypothetical protein